MSSMTVTNAQRRSWQQRAIKLLNDLTEQHKDLPVLTWQVSEFALVGKAVMVNDAERRVAFEAWTHAVHLQPWPERTSENGYVRLHAGCRDFEGYGVDLAITADLYEEVTS